MVQILTTERTKHTEERSANQQGVTMLQREIRVHELPIKVDEGRLEGSTVVVIDVLRATSTICTALAAGAREVIPFLEIDDALAAARAADREDVVLGGERHGGRIPGFDVGNSPSEYNPEIVSGKRVLITTTNGTRAMYRARLSRRVVIGAFVNLSAVSASLSSESHIDILCAGTDSHETREDILAAGAIIWTLYKSGGDGWDLTNAARIARGEWEAVFYRAQAASRPLNHSLANELRDTPGGRNLLGIGLDQDLVDCAQIDRFNIVPELDVAGWRITAAVG
jgi:2-phosphosulfolactate phosphatase